MAKITNSNNNAPIRSLTEISILKRLIPPSKLPKIIPNTIKRVEATIKKEQILATIVIGGSIAKGTYLKGDHDVDVFVRFSTEYNDEELQEHLEKILIKTFKKNNVERVHGSRDYYHIIQEGFTFEFIPVRNINNWQEAKNVTDMSPLHVQYVHDKLLTKPWLSQDIRLTKQFCKAAKVYGAESYIGGFSGHVIDLLIIYYGGFRELLIAASKWSAKTVIDPEKRIDNPLTQLNASKIYAPLIIVDPVQHDRNSAAAISKDAYNMFKKRAKEYLATLEVKSLIEHQKFFTITPLSVKTWSKEHINETTQVISIEIIPQIGKKDVVGAKCLKVYEYIIQEIVKYGFTIKSSTWEFNEKKSIILLAMPSTPLSPDEEWGGPPIHKTMDVARFKQKHKTTYTKDKRIFALEKRKYRNPAKLITDILKTKYTLERVKSAKCYGLVDNKSKTVQK